MSSATIRNNRKSNKSRSDEEPEDTHQLSKEVTAELVQMFKLFADETRLNILFHLKRAEELNVQSICNLLKQTQPAVSHHLALLRVAKLIEMRRHGKHNFYRLVPERFAEVLAALTQFAPAEARRLQANFDFSNLNP